MKIEIIGTDSKDGNGCCCCCAGSCGPQGNAPGNSGLENLVDGNATGSVRGIGAATGYTMGRYAIALGSNTTASGYASLAQGESTDASGDASHAEGDRTEAPGMGAHAEGSVTTASGRASHAQGQLTKALGTASHAEGSFTTASGGYSHAQGEATLASGHASHAGGDGTIAQGYAQTAIGMFNVASGNPTAIPTGNDNALIIGGGNINTHANAFRFQFNGQAYGARWNTSGADYAEMFEWLDGNPANEDRRGYFVTVQGGHIRKATDKDQYILGVISATPSVVGDSHGLGWRDMYMRDDFGEIIYEWAEAEREVTGEDQKEIVREHRPKPNSAYDPTKTYIPRDQRKEWAAVGMLGKLIVRDDGSCKQDGFCAVGAGGIATASESGYHVLERVGKDKVRIVYK